MGERGRGLWVLHLTIPAAPCNVEQFMHGTQWGHRSNGRLCWSCHIRSRVCQDTRPFPGPSLSPFPTLISGTLRHTLPGSLKTRRCGQCRGGEHHWPTSPGLDRGE
jgi:hypothetical protein